MSNYKSSYMGFLSLFSGVLLTSQVFAATAHVDAFTNSASTVAPGQSVHIATALTADTALTKPGYILLRVIDAKSNVIKVYQSNFNTLAAGATLNVAGDYVFPANAAAAGPYSLDATVWSPEVNIWKGTQWGLITIEKPSVPTAHVDAFTTSATAIMPGQTVHLTTALTADTALTKPGYIQLRLKDAKANVIKVYQADFNTLAAGATLNVAGDYVIPANAAAAGPYSLDANVWSPEINLWKGSAWGLITIEKPVVPTAHVDAFTNSASTVVPGQTVHITTALTADTALTKPGYIQLRVLDAKANVIKVYQADFNTLAAGATINVAGDYVFPVNAAAAGPYSLDANVWSPEINLWKGTPWGIMTVAKAAVTPPVVTPPVVTPPVVTPPVVTPPVVTPPVVTPPVVTPPVVTPPVVTPPVVTPPVTTPTVVAPQAGIWLGSGCTGLPLLAQYNAWLGSTAQHLTDNLDQSSWSNLSGDTNWEINCIKTVAKTTSFTLSVPMIPADGVSTLAKGAAGSYDSYFTTLATQLVAGGLDNLVIRIGWEFNGNWQPWASYKDPQNFIKYYQRIVTLMRAVPGQHFTFDWCPNIGLNALAPDQSYPGDAYVDYVGMDVYDAVWSSNDANVVSRWNYFVTEAYGLQWQVSFAKLHGKKLSLPEWGMGGNNSGDDPYFINQIAAWVKTNNYAYLDYWNSNLAYQGQLSLGQYPQAAAAYIKDFK